MNSFIGTRLKQLETSLAVSQRDIKTEIVKLFAKEPDRVRAALKRITDEDLRHFKLVVKSKKPWKKCSRAQRRADTRLLEFAAEAQPVPSEA